MSYELLQNLGCVYACLAIGYSPGIAYRNGNFSWGKWWLTDGLSYGFLAILFSISFSDTATLGCTKPRYVLERSNQRIFLGRLKAEFCCWNPQQLFGELPWPGWRPIKTSSWLLGDISIHRRNPQQLFFRFCVPISRLIAVPINSRRILDTKFVGWCVPRPPTIK